jgi:DNA invertase Pin-like site-specific DNA recombinase
MTTMSSVAAYVRVSSRSQSDEMQRDGIARLAQARGDEVVTWYAEKASARSLQRPVLNQLRSDVRTGLVRKVYVWRLDRLIRTGIRDMLDLIEQFERGGAELVTVSDGFDMGGPGRDIVIAVMAWAAEMERLAIGERIAAAIERTRMRGETWGRPPGFSAHKARRVVELKNSGKTIRAIAMALKLPKSTVGRILKSADQAPTTLADKQRSA